MGTPKLFVELASPTPGAQFSGPRGIKHRTHHPFGVLSTQVPKLLAGQGFVPPELASQCFLMKESNSKPKSYRGEAFVGQESQ